MRNLTRFTALATATAGALAFAGGVAFAAPAPLLTGPYTVTVTRTVSVGLVNQPVGQSGSEPWKFKQTCTPTTPTTCSTTLDWTGLSGKQFGYHSALTHPAKYRWTAAHTFTQTCRGHHGAKIAAGWSVSQGVNIVGSVPDSTGRLNHFNATISTTYTPTTVGTTGGCIAAKEVLTGAGTAAPIVP
jgi:hypothetical protein